jgi:hypothetical protein
MKISLSIASTTHIDHNNDKVTKSALDGMAKQIQESFVPCFIEHDSERQLGIILYGEVFQLWDKEHALGVVLGIFESDEECDRFKVGQPNTVWPNYKKYFNLDELRNAQFTQSMQKQNIENFTKNNSDEFDDIAAHLEEYFNKNNIRREDGRIFEIKAFIARNKGMEIFINSNDHQPPHFHVTSRQRNFNARFYLETLEFWSNKIGNISRNEIKAIQDFFKENPQQLQKLKDKYLQLFPDNKK